MSHLLLNLEQTPPNKADGGVQLLPNSPNPFVEMTLLWFSLPSATDVLLRIFDGLGREVAVKSGTFFAGENHMVLQRAELAEPGLYTYQLETVHGIARRKLMMY
jgi:hypothetical protein